MKIGVLGYGSIGKRHVTNLRNLGHEVEIYDPEADISMSRHSVIEHGDAVVIASPTVDHYDDILSCINRDRTFFVEKPICRTMAELEAIYPLLNRARAFVGYNLRFLPAVKETALVLGEHEIGEPRWANFNLAQLNKKPVYRRDGVILNWSHEIDLALHLLGPAKVTGSSTKLVDGQDVMTDILLTHEMSGCQTTIHLDYLTDPQIRGFMINGSKSYVAADLLTDTFVLGGNPMHGDGDFNQSYIDEMAAFIDFCEGKPHDGCTAREALEVMRICLDVRKAAGLGV